MHNVNMANIQVAPGKSDLERMLRRGLTQHQIVDAWEKETGVRVSRSTIGMAIKRYGLQSSTERPRHDDLLPWHVVGEHRNHLEARMLRLEARRRKGLPLSEADLQWVNNWRAELEAKNAVVGYDPAVGFVWLPREPTDSDIIRPGRI